MRPKQTIMSATRRQLLAKVHLLAKDAQLDDTDYRDFLERETGKRSAAVLTEAQLAQVCEKLGSKKPGAASTGPYAAKLRALWISAWHLGVARDKSDTAMIAFLKRQTGIETTRFLIDAKDASKAIEGVKSWLEREAGVAWWKWPDCPRRAVTEAQVRRLDELGDIKDLPHAHGSFLENYVCRVTGKNRGLAYLTDEDWDTAIAALGARLRRAMAKMAATSNL